MSVHKLLFHNKPGRGETVPKNRAVVALIIAAVFCGLLGLLGTAQGHTSGAQMETETVPSGYFQLTVWPAEVYVNVGEQIEIFCTIDTPLVNTPIEITSVDVLLFDSYDSVIREQAMTTWDPQDGYHYLSASTEYTVVGDEAYYQLKVNFSYIIFPSGNKSGEYTEYTAHSFPIVVNQE
jgi:hypothetical protein